jgi:hypothetical protein
LVLRSAIRGGDIHVQYDIRVQYSRRAIRAPKSDAQNQRASSAQEPKSPKAQEPAQESRPIPTETYPRRRPPSKRSMSRHRVENACPGLDPGWKPAFGKAMLEQSSDARTIMLPIQRTGSMRYVPA